MHPVDQLGDIGRALGIIQAPRHVDRHSGRLLTVTCHLLISHSGTGTGQHHGFCSLRRSCGLWAALPRLRPLACQANRQAGATGHQLHIFQRRTLGQQMLFIQRIEHGVTHAQQCQLP
ncbi:hypothetical protein D3C78_1543270 [compost metagenome]